MLLAAVVDLALPSGDGREPMLQLAGQVYRPLLAMLRNVPKARITVNLGGALAERLQAEGLGDVVSGFRDLALEGRVELTGTAKFHPILALISKEESRRQIRLNEETNRALFGEAYRPRGFFPPELAIGPEVLRTVSEMGYRWCIVDEIGYNGILDRVPRDRLFTVEGIPDLLAHFISRSGMSRGTFDVTTAPPTVEMLQQNETVTISELEGRIETREAIMPIRSSAKTSEDDVRRRAPLAPWQDPSDPAHQDLWTLAQWAIDAVSKEEIGAGPARRMLDEALHSSGFLHRTAAPKLLSTLELLGSPPSTIERAREIARLL